MLVDCCFILRRSTPARRTTAPIRPRSLLIVSLEAVGDRRGRRSTGRWPRRAGSARRHVFPFVDATGEIGEGERVLGLRQPQKRPRPMELVSMEAGMGGGGRQGPSDGTRGRSRRRKWRRVDLPLLYSVLLPLNMRLFSAGATERPKRRVLRHSVVRPPCRSTRQYHGGTICVDAWGEAVDDLRRMIGDFLEGLGGWRGESPER